MRRPSPAFPSFALALVAFALARNSGGEEPARPRGAVFGRVTLDAAGVAARIELRRLGDATLDRHRAGWPYAFQCADDRWLRSPVAVGDALATARSDARGRYRVEGLATGLYELRATTSGGVVGTWTTAISVDGATVEADVPLVTGTTTVTGRVVSADGTPVRAVVVVTQDERERRATPWLDGAVAVETDAEGRFSVGGFAKGRVEVSAIEPGVRRVRVEGIAVPRDAPLVVNLDADTAPVAGRVVDEKDGRPIAGASVGVLHAPNRAFALRHTAADGEGRYSTSSPRGALRVVASAPGFAPAEVDVAENARGEVVVRLRRVARVVGRVLAADGSAAPGARVRVVPDEDGLDRAPRETTSDADGRFEIRDVPPGVATVFAFGGGWCSEDLAEAEAHGWNPFLWDLAPRKTTDVDLRVVRTARVRGRVTASGQAVAGATIRADSGFHEWDVASDAEGRFTVDAAPRAPLWLTSRAVGHAPLGTSASSGPSGEDSDVALSFAPAMRLRVRIVDARGEPIARARVSVVLRSTGDPIATDDYVRTVDERVETRFIDVGPDGAATLGPFLRKRLELEFMADGFVSQKRMLDVERATAQEEAPLLVTLASVFPTPSQAPSQPTTPPSPAAPPSEPPAPPPVTHSIRGRVVVPASKDPRTVELTRGTAGEPPIGQWRDGHGIRIEVREDGSFEATGLAAGRYGFRAQLAIDGVLWNRTATADTGSNDLVLSLRASHPLPARRVAEPRVSPPSRNETPPTWTFRIVDPEGRPIPRGRAILFERVLADSAQSRAIRVEFRDGRLVHRAEQATTEYISGEFGAAEDAHGRFLPLAPTMVTTMPPSDDIVVRLGPALAIEGVVVRPDGTPERGVAVKGITARWPGGDERLEHELTTRTDSAGRFRLVGADDGEHLLSFDVRRRYARVFGVRVRAGDRSLRFELHDAVSPRLRVLDPDGRPLSGADARIEFADEPSPETFDDEYEPFSGPPFVVPRRDGDALVFRRLDPHRAYDLFVDPPQDIDLIGAHFPAWRPKADQEIRLERAHRIRGVAREPKGPIAAANVWYRAAGTARFDVVRSENDGTFEIAGLRAGDWDLVALRGGTIEPDEAEAARAVRVAAGASGVVVPIASEPR